MTELDPIEEAEVHEEEAPPMNIFQIINRIKREVGALAPVRTDGVPFAFRGIDGVVNHLAGKINEYGVTTVPTLLEHELQERQVGTSTKFLKTSKVKVAFTFYAEDGTSVTATTAGLADDYADRSAAQAQSVALRVALLQTFFLPTQDNEEAHSERVKNETEAAGVAASPSPARTSAPPSTPGNLAAVRGKIAAEAKKLGLDGNGINAIGDQVTGVERSVWFNNGEHLEKVLVAMQGKVAEKAAAE